MVGNITLLHYGSKYNISSFLSSLAVTLADSPNRTLVEVLTEKFSDILDDTLNDVLIGALASFLTSTLISILTGVMYGTLSYFHRINYAIRT